MDGRGLARAIESERHRRLLEQSERIGRRHGLFMAGAAWVLRFSVLLLLAAAVLAAA